MKPTEQRRGLDAVRPKRMPKRHSLVDFKRVDAGVVFRVRTGMVRFSKIISLRVGKLVTWGRSVSMPRIPAVVSSLTAAVMVVSLILTGFLATRPDLAAGAYTSSTTDADGNTHLANSSVNDTVQYDTSTDSDAATQQQLGIDPNWKNGVSRESYALKFNGSSNYASITSGSNMPTGNADKTIEAWVRPAALSGGNFHMISLLGTGGTTNGNFAIGLYTNDKFYASTWGASNDTVDTGSAITVGQWYHVAAVYNSTTGYLTIFVNGTQGATTNIGTTNTNSSKLTIGVDSTSAPTYYFNGSIDEVRITNGIRYSSNFTPSRRFKEDSATAALYHFDDGTGTTVSDSTNNLNDLTTSGSPSWVTGDNAVMDGFDSSYCQPLSNTNPANQPTQSVCPGGQTGAGNITLGEQSAATSRKAYDVRVTGSNALTFDGSNDFVRIPNSASISTVSAFTIEAWFKTTYSGVNHVAIYGFDDGGNGYELEVTGSGQILMWSFGGGSGGFTGGTGYNDGKWHHVAATYSATSTTYTIFVDGSQIGTASAGTVVASTKDAQIGAYCNGASSASGCNDYFPGQIDEVRLSSSVRYTSNFTPSRRFSTDGNTAGLWHLDEGTGTTPADSSGNSNNGILRNGTGNSPAADGTANGPLWSEGIASSADSAQNTSSSASWALPGYAFRKRVKVAATSAITAGYGVETTEDRGTKLDNKQARSDGKDWRVVYQPSNQYSSITTDLVSGSNVGIADSLFNVSTSAITVEGWFKPSSANSDGGNHDFILGPNNTTLKIDGANNQWYARLDIGGSMQQVGPNAASAITYGQWTHIAMVYNGSTLKLFVNGVQTDSVTVSGAITTGSGGTSLGNAGNGYSGGIDEVRFSSVARYSSTFVPQTTPFIADSSTIGLWHFDEGSGQYLLDSSGNNHTGVSGNDGSVDGRDVTWSTTDGMVSTTQEIQRFIPHGHSLALTGSGTYVRNANQIITSSPFTVEGWFMPKDFAATYTLFAQGSTSASNIAVQTTTGSKIQFMVDGSTVATGATTLSANTWYHYALTYDANASPYKARLYLNGTLEASQNISATFTGANITAGGSSKTTPDTVFNGWLDEIRVSSAVRYTGNFTPSTSPFATDSKTSVLWHLDDGSGTSAADNSGNSRTGTITSATWLTNGGKVDSINQTQFRTVAPVAASGTDSSYYLYYGNANESGNAQSYYAYALQNDGNNNSTTSATFPTSGNPMTLEAWVKLRNLPASGGTMTIMSINDSGNTAQHMLQVRNVSGTTRFEMVVNNNITNVARGTTSPVAGTWYHVMGTFNGTQVRIFVNGTLQTTKAFTATATAGGFIQLGNSGGGGKFDGVIDEARYSKVVRSTATFVESNLPFSTDSNTLGLWHFDDTAPTGLPMSFADSSGNGRTLTVLNDGLFVISANAGIVASKNLQVVTTEPTQSVTATENETPVFFQWRQAGGTWSTRAIITPNETQLGSELVYLKFNPTGSYSRQDYYRVASWAVEAFSTSSPQRGKRRSFPPKANLVASSGGLDVIDAATNKLWARFPNATNNIIGANAPLQLAAKNGRVYVASADGLTAIQFDLDSATRYTSSGNAVYASSISNRAAASTYGSASGNAVISTTVNDVSVAVIGTSPPKQTVGAATSTGMTVIQDVTANDPNNHSGGTALNYSKNTNNSYSDVFLTSGGKLYGGNSSVGGVDRYDSVQSDSSSQTTTSDATYNASSTPVLTNNSIKDISVTEGTSTADQTSNTLAVATNLGVDVIQEHTTFASGTVRHYTQTGDGSYSGYTSKQFGGATQFDGTNDMINVPDSNSLDVTTSFTLEAWVRSTGTNYGSYAPIFWKKGSSYNNNGYGMGISNLGNVGLFADNNTGISGTCPDAVFTEGSLGRWIHVAATVSGTSATLYCDGQQIGTGTMQGVSATTNPLTIGGNNNTGQFFQGNIDEARISNSVRYSGAFTPSRAPFTTDANTVGLWHFDETGGQNIYDSSSSANDGTLGATNSVASDDPFLVAPALGGTADTFTSVALHKSGDAGRYLTFNGANSTDAKVLVADSNSLDATTITAEAWVKNSDSSNVSLDSNMIFNKKAFDGDTSGWYVSIGSPNTITVQGSGVTTIAANCVTAWSTTDLNKWVHVAVTISSTTATIYCNGVKVGSGTVNAIAANTTPFLIGDANATNTGSWNGGIDEARVSNVVRYTGSFTPPRRFEPDSSTVGLWHFDDASSGTTIQTAKDYSANANNGILGATTTAAANDPAWTSSGSGANAGADSFWAGSSGTSTGAISDVSLLTDKQIRSYTTSNSGLPGNSVTSLSVGTGGLALVGSTAGAWAPGFMGSPIDDTAATPATANNPVRVKSGTTRIKGGTVRVKPN